MTRKVIILHIWKSKMEVRTEHKLPSLHLSLLKLEDFRLSVLGCNRSIPMIKILGKQGFCREDSIGVNNQTPSELPHPEQLPFKSREGSLWGDKGSPACLAVGLLCSRLFKRLFSIFSKQRIKLWV